MNGRPNGTPGFDDDDLRAMLAGRAGRAGPDAEPEVRADVSAAIRDTSRRNPLSFLALPLDDRLTSQPAGWLAAGLAALVVIALVGGRLVGPVGPTPSAGSSAAGAAASPSRFESPGRGPSSGPAIGLAATRMTLNDLRAGLADGSLDGRIVIVTGRLQIQSWPCPVPTPVDCFGLQLRSLEGVEVAHTGVTRADVGAHIGDAPIAFRVTGRQPTLLGWLSAGADAPQDVIHFLSPADKPGPAEVAIVAGWVTGRDAAACPDLSGMASFVPCPAGAAWLTSRPPSADGSPVLGSAGTMVQLDPAVTLPKTAGSEGPFLIAPASGDGIQAPAHRLVARLDPARTVIVDGRVTANLPSSLPSASPQAVGGQIDIDAFRLAIQTGELDRRLVLLPGTLVETLLPCPSGTTEPCSRLGIQDLDGVPLTWDGAAADGPPSGGQDSTLAVVPGGGSLRLLGRLAGDPDHAPSYQELISRYGAFRGDPYWVDVVSGWLVVGGIHSCPALGPDATPCPGPGPLLTDRQPMPDGMMTSGLQVPVVVSANAPGMVPGQVVTPGPFLIGSVTCGDVSPPSVASCANAAVEIVARYDPATVIRVVHP